MKKNRMPVPKFILDIDDTLSERDVKHIIDNLRQETGRQFINRIAPICLFLAVIIVLLSPR